MSFSGSVDETRHVDVVVVGSGISGSAAAMTAARQGARVVLLEKQKTLEARPPSRPACSGPRNGGDAYRARIPLGNPELGARLVGDYEDALAELRASGARVAAEPKLNIMTSGTGYRPTFTPFWSGAGRKSASPAAKHSPG